MNTKVLTTLEYTKIIDLLTEKADSEPGKKLCRDLVPSTDLSTIRTADKRRFSPSLPYRQHLIWK